MGIAFFVVIGLSYNACIDQKTRPFDKNSVRINNYQFLWGNGPSEFRLSKYRDKIGRPAPYRLDRQRQFDRGGQRFGMAARTFWPLK